ncbi:saccharopine dehydrogenase family protein [Williamsia sterculiae]|uniref:Uncharacterized conserved protein n=1 Tax=Williamsia sterculiae TaxID=1344003 RepID=A0A1N7HFD2_9NOCA|nr:saccharopine dehydrogenase NADP-binding domain-containing protein [Williamsia sterculiae]SIS23431.1 Uncharacterized conserved protein [Williamsia sterculiae]
MAGRIVIFGATGYTGTLIARSLTESGLRPVLAARSAQRLERLADDLGGLDTAIADVTAPHTVRALVERGDVLVSTVGPFARWGQAAAEAAIDAGAHYVDSTGEPAFIRQVFEHYGPAAEPADCAMLPSFGFDWVPGNLAGAMAMTDAGPNAVRLDIGYFSRGGGVSGGTTASMLGVVVEPSFAYRRGRLRSEPIGARVKRFDLDTGKPRQGISVGGSEHFGLPSLYPSLQDVDVILGKGGKLTRAMPLVTKSISAATAVAPIRRALTTFVHNRVTGSTGGPDDQQRATGTSTIIADARGPNDQLLQRVRLDGPNGYTFTADIIAWAASVAARGELRGRGGLGPVAAFGLEALTAAAAQVGLNRTR